MPRAREVAYQRRSSSTPKRITLILTGWAGVIVGLSMLFVDRPWWDERALRFAETPEFALYVAVFCANVGTAAIAAIFVVREVRDVWCYRAGQGRELLGSLVLLIALAGTVLTVTQAQLPDYPLAHRQAKLWALTTLIAALAFVAAIGIWLIQAAVERTFERDDAPTVTQIARFVELRERMQLLLTSLSVMLGGAILNAGALRLAVLADNPDADFPAELVLIYGAAVSGLIALGYAPTHARTLAIGRDVRDRCFPMPSPSSASWAAWQADRKAFEELLGLQARATGSLRVGASILTPLAGSIVSLLLGTAR